MLQSAATWLPLNHRMIHILLDGKRLPSGGECLPSGGEYLPSGGEPVFHAAAIPLPSGGDSVFLVAGICFLVAAIFFHVGRKDLPTR